jgi:hypothetical protein
MWCHILKEADMKTTRLTITSAILVVVLAVVFVPFQTARADLGPKPSMHFEFVFEVTPAPTIVSGIQFECQAADCSDAKPFEGPGTFGFNCGLAECSSKALIYYDYHRLSIDFSDGKTRQSNVFGKEYFEAYYRVTVRGEDLLVEELPGKSEPPAFFAMMAFLGASVVFCPVAIIGLLIFVILLVFIIQKADFRAARGWYIAGWVMSVSVLVLSLILDLGLVVTLIVELVLALAYTFWRRWPRTKLLTVVLMMNLITQPALWLFVSVFNGNSTFWLLAIGEVIVWLVESGILAFALRKQAKFWEALALSLALNLTSFGVGLLLPL